MDVKNDDDNDDDDDVGCLKRDEKVQRDSCIFTLFCYETIHEVHQSQL